MPSKKVHFRGRFNRAACDTSSSYYTYTSIREDVTCATCKKTKDFTEGTKLVTKFERK